MNTTLNKTEKKDSSKENTYMCTKKSEEISVARVVSYIWTSLMYKCLVSMCASSIFKYCLYAYICYVFFIYVISKCSHSRVLHQVNTKCNNFFLYLFIFFCRCCVCVHAVLRYVLRLCMLSYNTKKNTFFSFTNFVWIFHSQLFSLLLLLSLLLFCFFLFVITIAWL